MVRKSGKANLATMLEGIGDHKIKPETQNDTSKLIKVKRCYAITDLQLEKLMLLKAKVFRGMDLSDIVGMALDDFYELKGGKKEWLDQEQE
jgi:hypothetical protein